MKIHREGKKIFYGFLILSTILITGGLFLLSSLFTLIILTLFLTLILIFLARFFRVPVRKSPGRISDIISPADGKVVVIEEVDETSFLNQRMLQISIFMSVWDVHINWYPQSGKVLHSKHFPGKYFVARVPKSSQLNEQHVTVLEIHNGTNLIIKQIAGAVARRIINYARIGNSCTLNQEMGFIRFGSRVDVLMPLSYRPVVKKGDRVKGKQDVIAMLK